jgi:hypothetical protein
MEVDSQTEVFETPSMLRHEWRMRLARPRTLDCIRRSVAMSLARHGDRLVSLRMLPLPRIESYTAGMRAIVAYQGIPERFLTDVIVLGHARTAIVVSAGGIGDESDVLAEALACARVLSARIRS